MRRLVASTFTTLDGVVQAPGGPGEDEDGNRYPLLFEIDEFRCIFCGYCQEVCPEEAIHMGRHYENSEYSRAGMVYDLERLMAQTHPVSTLWDPADPKGE